MAKHRLRLYKAISVKSRLLLTLIALLLALGGCENKKQEDNPMLFYEKGTSLSFDFSDEAIVNPFMGFAPNADCEDAAALCSLVYVDVTFRELEPEEGVFNFKEIENRNFIARWKSEGKHAVFRFVCDKPSDKEHMDIPDWLYDKIGGNGKKYDTSYGKGFSPDYSNQTFIQYHAKAIEALGSHFGQDTFIGFVELGSLGHWGEWHVKHEDGIPKIPTEEIRRQYITPYIAAFPNAKIMMRRPFKAAKEYGFGLFNDMAGEPESTAEWLDWIKNGGDYAQADEENALVPMTDGWKKAPVGGEFTSSLSMDWMLKTNLIETTALLSKSHTTFLGPKVPVDSKKLYETDLLYKQGMDAVIKSIGYRLGILKADISKRKNDGTAAIELTWTNKGSAPLYFDLPVRLYVLSEGDTVVTTTDIDVNLTALTMDKSVKSRTVFSYGGLQTNYKICVGILDPMTDAPSVKLINAAENIDNRMLIYQENV